MFEQLQYMKNCYGPTAKSLPVELSVSFLSCFILDMIKQLTERVEQITERVGQITERVGQITERVGQTTERVGQIIESGADN